MTGGKVIVLNTQKSFDQYISESAPSSHDLNEIDSLDLKTLLEKHVSQTGSEPVSYTHLTLPTKA